MRGAVAALTFAPDGKSLVWGAYGAIVTEGRPLPVPLAQVQALVFAPDRKSLWGAGGTPGVQGSLCRLAWPSGTLLETRKPHRDLIVGVAVSAAGLVATASHDGTARYGERLLEGHTGPVLGIAFSEDEALVVTACSDGSLRVFESATGKLVRTLSQHTDRIHALAFQPGQPRCATASRDRTVRLWQPGIGRMVRIVRGFEGSVLCLAFSPDAARLYTGGEEGLVRVLDSESDRVLVQWRASAHWLLQVVVSPDGKTLATSDSAGGVRRWDALSGAPLPSPASGAGGTQRPLAGARRR